MDGFVEKIIRFGKMSALMHGKHGNLKPRSLKVKKGPRQGCQMVYFQTKNPNLGTFWSVLQ
jgi:hypothetical protein